MHSNLKRRLAIGVVAVAATAFAGGAYAATKDSNASSRQAFLNDVAKRLHVTPAQLTSAFEGAAVDQINAAVAAGKLTQAEGNALKQRIQQGQLPLGAPGFFPVGPGFPRPFGPAGPFGPGGKSSGNLAPPQFRALPPGKVPFPPAPGLFAPVGGPMTGAAAYLGISTSQLLKELGAGKSLAQIAKAQGKSAAGLKAAMIAPIKAKLDKAVASKMLTRAQEQRILGNTSNALGALINRSNRGFGFVRPGIAMPWRFARPVPPKGLIPAPPPGSPRLVPPKGPAGLIPAPAPGSPA